MLKNILKLGKMIGISGLLACLQFKRGLDLIFYTFFQCNVLCTRILAESWLLQAIRLFLTHLRKSSNSIVYNIENVTIGPSPGSIPTSRV